MQIVDIAEAKRRFSELVDRAQAGERIGISVDGKLKAVLECPRISIEEAFKNIEQIRRRVRKPPRTTVKSLIETGRV